MQPQTIELFPETLLVTREGERIYTTTRSVAFYFGKRHDNVMRTLQKVIEELDDPEFSVLNFEVTQYPDRRGKLHPEYRLTHDGFLFLTMGFTGRKAMRWRKAFVQAFRQKEAELAAMKSLYLAALDQMHPNLRPTVEDFERGLPRSATAARLGKSAASVTYHRRRARLLGLLPARQKVAA